MYKFKKIFNLSLFNCNNLFLQSYQLYYIITLHLYPFILFILINSILTSFPFSTKHCTFSIPIRFNFIELFLIIYLGEIIYLTT